MTERFILFDWIVRLWNFLLRRHKPRGSELNPCRTIQEGLDQVPFVVNETHIIHIAPHPRGKAYKAPRIWPRVLNATLFLVGGGKAEVELEEDSPEDDYWNEEDDDYET